MFHLAAYSASIATGVETDLTPVTDGILTIQNAHFLPPFDMNMWFAAAMATNLQRARFNSGTLRIPTTPFIRPIMAGLVPVDPVRFRDYSQDPLVVKGIEELAVLALQNAAGAQRVTCLVGLGLNRVPQPSGNIITMRGTSTTAAVANAWTQLQVTWQDTIAAGTYAIVGLDHQSANGQGCRLVVLNQYWRPGAISNPGIADRGDVLFRNGDLGEWGRFTANYLPIPEVLCNAADAAHEIYLHFVRVSGAIVMQ